MAVVYQDFRLSQPRDNRLLCRRVASLALVLQFDSWDRVSGSVERSFAIDCATRMLKHSSLGRGRFQND